MLSWVQRRRGGWGSGELKQFTDLTAVKLSDPGELSQISHYEIEEMKR